MISIKNPIQIQKMRDSGKILYDALQESIQFAKAGVSTKEVDEVAERYIRKYGAVPAFKGYEGFPGTLCTSVNDAIVHGIPSDKEILKDGDILSLDCGVILDGMYSDSAITVGIGEISYEAKKLIEITEKAFFEAAKVAIAGHRLGEIGKTIEKICGTAGYGIVENLTGHGIGTELHEDPQVFHYFEPRSNGRLYKNMTICVEPMITLGAWENRILKDGWTIKTLDGSLCSHYEHTLLIQDGLPELLTYPGFTWKEVA